ncbi:dipeptidase [Chromobacterium sp. F49]|uniref:M15 family metallopeptidase n=2 Tax=Chromobacteriaceae TaxID=1499392 RepID=UPI0005BB09E8|nr:M15 family metallopeptidase [Chromobacterium subtsugae]KUM03808.1 dipeptidase [Chromobacterium subtsugae]KZE85527.1 dipeptidase [Chromobacterium sp. F49]OBU84761.1 dipeptidase [Chromobacterium subtsugae]WVH60855.1 M15 family metallopeptidase [Chromobacterium subtsugae]
MDKMLTLADPSLLDIPVAGHAEPFVDLAAYPDWAVDRSRSQISSRSPHFLKARQAVAERLRDAAGRLPDGLRLYVKEAYRPLARQRRSYDEHLVRLRGLQPELDEAALLREASLYVAPPAVAPHPTGAALDVTLIDAAGAELDMGCPFNADAEESRGACYTDSPGLCAQARANRRILILAMRDAGFVNYPSEWWHWSYGDRYWAAVSGAPAALYAAVDESFLESA